MSKDTKHIKLSLKDGKDKFADIGEKIRKKEIKFSYYAIDNDIGYYYYELLT